MHDEAEAAMQALPPPSQPPPRKLAPGEREALLAALGGLAERDAAPLAAILRAGAPSPMLLSLLADALEADVVNPAAAAKVSASGTATEQGLISRFVDLRGRVDVYAHGLGRLSPTIPKGRRTERAMEFVAAEEGMSGAQLERFLHDYREELRRDRSPLRQILRAIDSAPISSSK